MNLISSMKTNDLIPPYGGNLVNLLLEGKDRVELSKYASSLPSVQLSARSMCDLELLAVGAFSPLNRFMGKKDYASVLDAMRLGMGRYFQFPSLSRLKILLEASKSEKM